LSWAYGFDVVSFVAALTAAFLIHSQRPERVEGEEHETGWDAVLSGVRYLKGKRILQSTFTVDIAAMLFAMPPELFPVLAGTQFHAGPIVVGLLFAGPAFGAIVGAATWGWIGRIRRLGLAILIAVTVWGAAIAAFGLVGSNLGLALAFLAIAGGADVI